MVKDNYLVLVTLSCHSHQCLCLIASRSISESDGEYGKGGLTAELDINPDLWFFDCHFNKDAVMPGCLGVDAMWQLIGFYLGWLGGPGRGRALGAGQIKFTGQVLPQQQKNNLQCEPLEGCCKKTLYGCC